jgi:hypothetical protein
MKKSLFKWAVPALLLGHVLVVNAANELVVQVVNNGQPGQGLTVKVDGDTQKTIDRSGLVFFDLSAGSHSIQLLDGENSLHGIRFDSANGQLTDINMLLVNDEKPKVAIENYFNCCP